MYCCRYLMYTDISYFIIYTGCYGYAGVCIISLTCKNRLTLICEKIMYGLKYEIK